MKKNLILYALLIIYLLLNLMLSAKVSFYNEIINPLLWMIICGVAIYLGKDTSARVKDDVNKTQSLIIVLIIYIIFYFLLGLVFGYQKTPYAKDIFSIIKNLWAFCGIIFFQEIVRNTMLRIEKKSVVNNIIIIVLFTLANISFLNIGVQFSNVKLAFTYTASILIPLLISNCVFTYLSYIGGPKLPIIYRLFVTVPEFVLPIIPNFDWFMTAILGVVLPLVVFVYLNFIHLKKDERLSKRDRRKYNPIVYVPTFVIIGVVVCFVMGVFKYQPLAALSGSMSPTFNRGDAVVVKKLTKKEKDELQKGDIIQFTSGSKFVIHRIIETSNDVYGNRVFITKGDANNAKDAGVVNYDNIVGKVSFIIPYIGYPSVWLNGMI